MAKKLDERVKEAFTENDKEQAIKYLDWLRPTILDYAASIRRSSLVMILLVAIFELVISAKDIKITIGSFQVARGSIVLVFLPPLIAYLYMQAFWDTVRADYLREAFVAIFKIWSPKAEKNDFDDLLTPSQLMYFSVIGGSFHEETKRRIDKLEDSASSIFVVSVIFGVVAFEGQAYFVLFPHHLGEAFTWTISLCITIFCLCITVLTLYYFARDDN